MVKKAVSWVLAGLFAYLWWWAAYRWSYLHSPGNQWTSIFVLFTLISLVVLARNARVTGAGMFDGLIGTVRGFVPSLPWLALAIVVVRAAAWLHTGVSGEPLDNLIHAIVAVLVAAITTVLWYGAIENAAEHR